MNMAESITCNMCFKPVKSNMREIYCNICHCWIQGKCVKLSDVEFNKLGKSDEPWFCHHCIQSIFPFNSIVNDVEFVLSTTNSIITITNTDTNSFNPFCVDDSKFLVNDMDLDSDCNYCNDLSLPDSRYVISTDLNELRKNSVSQNTFSLLHVNCRSIVQKF